MSHLLVREPGLQSTVQDTGRDTARRYGVPRSGAIDPSLLRLANELVGNDATAAALEVRLAGPTLEVHADSVRVACAGPATLTVTRDGTSRTESSWRSLTLGRGDLVAVRSVTPTTTAYLAVAGGIDVPPVLGSRSTYVRAALGGLEGRALRAGDRLPLARDAAPSGPDRLLPEPPRVQDAPLRVVLGPQEQHFTAAARALFASATFTVSNDVDRMGMRLDGPRLEHAAADRAEIVSEAVIPGAIQVPGDGRPIVLLADGQTVGGYPKLATVISADLGRAGTAAPGSSLRFAVVDVPTAEAAARRACSELRALVGSIRPLSGGFDLQALYECNLIGGVVDMTRPDETIIQAGR